MKRSLSIRTLAVGCGWLIAWVVSAGAGRTEEKPVDFNRDIRPILSSNCFKCHGPDEKERPTSMRLDTKEGAFAPLEGGGMAIVAGNSGQSVLYQRISSTNPDHKMPPRDSGKSLTAQQVELIRRWIDQGATWREHWSFVKPVKHALPAVSRPEWCQNAIDYFILARLDKEGLSPSPEADKTTLIRRLTYDLTGLPPTPAEVSAFLADTRPDAYEQLVDRLLKSPRYGEHMARYWLDVARYGDTHGLHLDNERSMWPYRDWVIGAFNRNLPFDQFTIEQIAGDLLPGATLEQRIATGFNRCNVSTSEGGSIDEEVRVRYAVDRVETLSTVFLGLTLGCAVCHEHKFDPVSQKEFYQLFAFYGSTADAAMDGNALSPPPVVKVPSAEQTAALQSLDQQLTQVRQTIAAELAKVEYTDPGAGTATAPEPKEYVWIEDALPPGANPQGNSPWEFVGKPDHPVYSGEKASRRSAQGLSQHFFTGASPGVRIGEGDKLFAYVYLDPANPPKEIMLQFNDGSWEHRAYWGEDVIPWGAGGSPSRLPLGPLPKAGEWVRLEVEASKVGLASGAVLNGWAFTQHDGTVYWDKAGIVTRTPQAGQSFESLAEWDAFERSLSKSNLPQPVQQAVKTAPENRSDEQKKQIRDYFLEYVYGPTRATLAPLHQQRDALTKQRTDLENSIPTSLVMAELPQPRETFMLIRGAYDKRGQKVTHGTPAVLPPMPKDAPPNRLGLAMWLVDPEHPLTARVTVNRFWQQYFGRGIVKTAEDFGSQGQWPSHPELLDWLAVDFIESGWDTKRLQKLIVMSSTYRQASNVTPPLLQVDPENVLLARGPRFRLDAEVVRDMALYVSGLLVEKIGGRSVKPYQPPGIWEAVGFVGSNTREYKQEGGEALYRRSMYTFWKRTAPPPSLMAFDAPSRETCVARRARTNTPLQALVLMNDEQYVEAARNFAQRIMLEGGSTPDQRLEHGFCAATARKPQPMEMQTLRKLLDQNLAHYQAHPDAAAALLKVGQSPRNESLDASEHAAWTMIASLLLNLDETVTKE